jgi:alkylation response protein AidB-like acyl-CoA dehydrogenase
MESAMAKLYATETAKKVSLAGVQLHGGYGYTMEYDIQRYARDSLVMTIGGGTSEIQKNLIAKSLGL